MTGGILAVWTDVTAEAATEFEAWYNEEHLPERVGIPGFVSGARYRALRGTPVYFAWYATEDAAVLASPAYRTRLDHPTERTRRVMPNFRNTVRAVLRCAARVGVGRGGVAATLRIAAEPDRGPALDAWIREVALPGLARSAGVVGAQLWLGDPGPARDTAETALRGRDASCTRAVLLEAVDPAAADAALAGWLSPPALRHAGAAAIEAGLYDLRMSLVRADLPEADSRGLAV